MTENSHPNSQPDQPDPGRNPRSDPQPHRWASRIIPAAAFLVGLALGGVLVWAAVGGDGDSSTAAEGSPATASPSAGPSADAAASSGTNDTTVTVPAACEQAADNLREAISLLRGGTDSVEKFRPQQIVDLLNKLEDIDAETRPLVSECSQVDVSSSPVASPTASTSS